MQFKKSSKAAAPTTEKPTKAAITLGTVPAVGSLPACVVTIGEQGVSVPPLGHGRNGEWLAKKLGTEKPFFQGSLPRGGLKGRDIESIPLADQPARFSLHGWASRGKAPVTITMLPDAIRLKLVKLVPCSYKGNPEVAVVPASWEPGQKAPRLTGILPSKTFKEGRVEGWASVASDTQAENSTRRAGGLVLPGAAKPAKAAVTKPAKPAKGGKVDAAKGAKASAAKAGGATATVKPQAKGKPQATVK